MVSLKVNTGNFGTELTFFLEGLEEDVEEGTFCTGTDSLELSLELE